MAEFGLGVVTENSNLAAALVAALADLTVVEKGRTAKIVTKDKGTYTYDFADIADVVRLTRPRLAEHGLVALTPVHEHGNGLACTVVLLHSSGERMDFDPFPFPHGATAQATGSAVTYHRRYCLVAALGMAAGDDDDGAAAQPRQQEHLPQGKNRKVPAGWSDLDSWDDAAQTYAEALAALPETVRSNVKTAKAERGLGWPVTPEEMTELLTLVDSYVVKPDLLCTTGKAHKWEELDDGNGKSGTFCIICDVDELELAPY